MTDFRALCAELLLALEGEGYTHWTHSPDEDDLVLRARAALAEPKPPCRYIYNPSQIAECGGPCEQGPKHCDCGELWMVEPEPAVPEGREPASVVSEPIDEEIMELWHGSDWYNEGATLREFLSITRAVLTRWGNPAPQPPDNGEVADEVRYLVYELRDQADDLDPSLELFGLIHNAADLLQSLSPPQPVQVSERLPEPKDCDEEGRCWWGEPQIGDSHDATWNLCTQDEAEEYCTWGTKYGWLPAHALPLPTAND